MTAHALLWNQLTYRCHRTYFSIAEDACDAEYTDRHGEYAPILGRATCQQIAGENGEAWHSLFELVDEDRSDDPSVTEKPSPPSYCEDCEDGYKPRGLVRNDSHEFE